MDKLFIQGDDTIYYPDNLYKHKVGELTITDDFICCPYCGYIDEDVERLDIDANETEYICENCEAVMKLKADKTIRYVAKKINS